MNKPSLIIFCTVALPACLAPTWTESEYADALKSTASLDSQVSEMDVTDAGGGGVGSDTETTTSLDSSPPADTVLIADTDPTKDSASAVDTSTSKDTGSTVDTQVAKDSSPPVDTTPPQDTNAPPDTSGGLNGKPALKKAFPCFPTYKPANPVGCGVAKAGGLHCWQGSAFKEVSAIFGAKLSGKAVDAACSGNVALCAVLSDGSIGCVGSDAPKAPGGKDFVAIDGNGQNETGFCARTSAGTAVCFGNPEVTGSLKGETGLVDVRAGGTGACGIKKSGKVVCDWSGSPVDQTPNDTFTQIDVNGVIACGLKAPGSIVCWMGKPGSGDAGYASDYKSQIPKHNDFITLATELAGGCAVRKSGQIVCWWPSKFSYTPISYIPPADPSIHAMTIAKAGASYTHACALSTSGAAVCFGPDDKHKGPYQ